MEIGVSVQFLASRLRDLIILETPFLMGCGGLKMLHKTLASVRSWASLLHMQPLHWEDAPQWTVEKRTTPAQLQLCQYPRGI